MKRAVVVPSPNRFCRRTFVKATGIGLGFLPLLQAERQAHAAGPKRLLMIAWGNGVRAGEWWPDARRSPDYSHDSGATGVTETSFSLVGRKISEPLEPHRSDLVLFQGVRLAAGGPGHESQPHLFRVSGGQTLDQHVGAAQQTPFKTLNLAVQKRDNRGHIYRNGANVTLEQNPYKLFDTLFAGRAIDPAIFERQRASRKSILDYVGKQLQDFRLRLGSADRQAVDAHMTSLREVEKRLNTGGNAGPAGAPPSLPETKFDVTTPRNFNLVTRAHMDLMVLALAADFTRVTTLLMGDGNGDHLVTPWLGPQYGMDTGLAYLGLRNSQHGNSHVLNEVHNGQQRWHATEFAYLAQKLKDTPDPAGRRLFDSSVMLVINNMNTGGGHGTNNLPTFTLGNAGGAFRTGRYLKIGGAPQTQILASVAAAVGVPMNGATELPRLKG
jgi:hypothetical protein